MSKRSRRSTPAGSSGATGSGRSTSGPPSKPPAARGLGRDRTVDRRVRRARRRRRRPAASASTRASAIEHRAGARPRPPGARPGAPRRPGPRVPRARRAPREPGDGAKQRTYKRSFFDRYRSLIVGGGIVAGLLLFGAFIFLGSTGTTYACSSQVDPESPASAAPSATPAARTGHPRHGPQPHHPRHQGRLPVLPAGVRPALQHRRPRPDRAALLRPDAATEPQGWIHNLEHGGFAILYNCSQPGSCTQAELDELRALVSNFPASPHCNIQGGVISPVIARFDAMKTKYAAVVWNRTLLLDKLDIPQMLEFWNQWGERNNPERQCAAAVRRARRSSFETVAGRPARRDHRQPRAKARRRRRARVRRRPARARGIRREPGGERGAFGQPGLELIEPRTAVTTRRPPARDRTAAFAASRAGLVGGAAAAPFEPGEIPATMQALVKASAAAGAELREVPVPEPGPGELLVRVEAASLCGTDLHIYRWDEWAQERLADGLPRIFGHEMAGRVVAHGPGVSRRDPARHPGRGRDPPRRRHLLPVPDRARARLREHADRRRRHRRRVRRSTSRCRRTTRGRSNGLAPEIAAIMEPMGNAVHAAFVEEIAGQTVAVLGCGPIGLMAIAIANLAGAARIFATDINPERLEMAREMGADVAARRARRRGRRAQARDRTASASTSCSR